MKSIIWTSICILILSSVLAGDQIVGSFSKGSLAENSMTLDRSLKLALSDIKSFYGDNVKTIKPLDVYLQIVAGINYKFIMAYLNKNDASLHINVSIVYSPLETDQSASFQILNRDEVKPVVYDISANDQATVKITQCIGNALKDYLKDSKITIDKISSAESYNNIIQNEEYYALLVTQKEDNANPTEIYYVINKSKDTCKVLSPPIAK